MGKGELQFRHEPKPKDIKTFLLSQHMFETLVSHANCVWPASVNDFVKISPKH